MSMFTRIMLLVAGVLLIVSGVMMFGTPASNIIALSIVIAIMLLASGIASIIGFFSAEGPKPWGELIIGILSTILGGLALFTNTGLIVFTAAIPYMFAGWMIVAGIFRIAASFQIKRLGVSFWWIPLVVGILGLIAGILLANNFVASVLAISTLLAISFIIQGIGAIVAFFTSGVKN